MAKGPFFTPKLFEKYIWKAHVAASVAAFRKQWLVRAREHVGCARWLKPFLAAKQWKQIKQKNELDKEREEEVL